MLVLVLVLEPEHLLTRHTLPRESLVLLLELVLALVLLLSWPAVLSPLWPTPRSLLTAL